MPPNYRKSSREDFEKISENPQFHWVFKRFAEDETAANQQPHGKVWRVRTLFQARPTLLGPWAF